MRSMVRVHSGLPFKQFRQVFHQSGFRFKKPLMHEFRTLGRYFETRLRRRIERCRRLFVRPLIDDQSPTIQRASSCAQNIIIGKQFCVIQERQAKTFMVADDLLTCLAASTCPAPIAVRDAYWRVLTGMPNGAKASRITFSSPTATIAV